MKIVRVIPALPKDNKQLRVAAYCRVSTSNKAQLRSLDIQIETYTKMIRSNKDWLFAGVFYDIESAGCIEAAELSCIKCLERLRKEK
jgi:site-specific DNA recombinase